MKKSKVKEYYELYSSLLEGNKTIESNNVALQPGGNSRKRWLEASVRMVHVRLQYGKIDMKQGFIEHSKYGVQVFIETFMKEPICRLDSDGPAHEADSTIAKPLNMIKVNTPHFHRYNELGQDFAYRTSLLNEREKEIQNDINLGLNHLCDEFSINTPNGKEVIVQKQIPTLFELPVRDLHKGISFY